MIPCDCKECGKKGKLRTWLDSCPGGAGTVLLTLAYAAIAWATFAVWGGIELMKVVSK